MKARVTAETITVAGEVNGEIQCVGRVEICLGGRVHGEIQAGTLVMQEGALLRGQSQDGRQRRATTEESQINRSAPGAARTRR